MVLGDIYPKGKTVISQMMNSFTLTHQDQTGSMGEGSERIMQRMMLDIPLGARVSYYNSAIDCGKAGCIRFV